MNFKLLKQASQKTFFGVAGAAALSIVAMGTGQAEPITVVLMGWVLWQSTRCRIIYRRVKEYWYQD